MVVLGNGPGACRARYEPAPLADEVRSHVERLSSRICEAVDGSSIHWGCVLGSGLSDVLEQFEVVHRFALPDFGPYLHGHLPEIHICDLNGHLMAFCTGRHHVYESLPISCMAFHSSLLHALGARSVVLCNAAGSLDPVMRTGSLMIIRDHLDTTFHVYTAELVRKCTESADRGPSSFYSAELINSARQVREEFPFSVAEGVYAYVTGPFYETPAEIRALGLLGAQAVGMSTVPEAIVASALGMEVLGLSVITNMATGLADTAHSHEVVVETAGRASGNLGRLIGRVVERTEENPGSPGMN